jgi:hypothetical protein
MTDFTQPVLTLGHLTAAADYSAETNHGLAVIQTNQTAVLVSALGQRPIGLLQGGPVSGQPAEVAVSGLAEGRYGGTVAVGDDLVAIANGRLATRGAANGGPTIARAIFSGVDGDVHAVWVNPPERISGATVIPFSVSAIEAATVNKVASLPIGALFGSGRIVRLDAVITTTLVGAGGAVTVNAEIDTVDVTGGVVTLAIGTPTVGTFVAGTAVTAANTFTAASVLDIEWVVGTAFTAGAVTLLLTIA